MPEIICNEFHGPTIDRNRDIFDFLGSASVKKWRFDRNKKLICGLDKLKSLGIMLNVVDFHLHNYLLFILSKNIKYKRSYVIFSHKNPYKTTAFFVVNPHFHIKMSKNHIYAIFFDVWCFKCGLYWCCDEFLSFRGVKPLNNPFKQEIN